MNIGKNSGSGKLAATKPSKNSSMKTMAIIVVGVITALLIVWVYTMGRKAEETVQVAMYAEDMYKNEVVYAETSFVPYDMLKGEYEKYAVDEEDGVKTRRIVLYDEIGDVDGAYAAYPLHKNTVAMWSDYVTSKVDNSDSVLYSFPGKNIVKLDIADEDLGTFKKFLQPGDRINITAMYKEKSKIKTMTAYGEEEEEEQESLRQEILFKDIMLADLLNDSGDSILDIYASYKDMTVWEQQAMDNDDSFQESIVPSAMLVAFTPEEEKLYYEYISRGEVEFKLSLPQRDN